MNLATYFYVPQALSWQRGVTLFHDLTSGAYEASYLVNERGAQGWKINLPVSEEQFSVQAASRAPR